MEREELVFSAKYPFTEKAKEVQRQFNIEQLNNQITLEAERRLARAISEKENPREIRKEIDSAGEETLKEMIASYPLMKIVASITKDRLIKNKAGQSEANKVRHYLEFENTRKIEKVTQEVVPIQKEEKEYILPMADYLANRPMRKKYKLVNMPLKQGQVHLTKEDIIEVVTNKVHNSFLETNPMQNPPKQLTEVAERIEKYKEKLLKNNSINYGTHPGAYRKRWKKGGKIDHNAFPPCIQQIHNELESGEDTGHQARFVLATFMVNIGMNIDEMLKPYSGQQNYNEERTRYYLKHASGKEGSGTEYTAPSCSKMKTYGLCPTNCKVNHPLTYYYEKKGGRKNHATNKQNNK